MDFLSRFEAGLIRQPRVQAALGAADGQALRRLPPRQLEVQPTARCHRTCSFCSHIVRNRRGGELPGALVENLLQEVRQLGTEHVGFSGGGEPLIWEAGDLARALVQAAQFARVTLTTSGDQFWDDRTRSLSGVAREALRACQAVLLNVPEVDDGGMSRLIADGPSWVRTRQMLQALVGWRDRERLRCLVTCVVVVNQHNLGSLVAIDRTFRELGIDQTYYKQFKAFEPGREGMMRSEAGAVLTALEGEDCARWSEGLSRFVAHQRRQLTAAPAEAGRPCWVNRLGFGLIIDPLGEAFLCTPTVGDGTHGIGNVYESSLKECWEGSRREAVLEWLNARSAAGLCPVECRYHTYNRVIDRHAHAGRHEEEIVGAPDVPNAGQEEII